MSLTAREELEYRREIQGGVEPRRELQIRRALAGKTDKVETPEKSFMQALAGETTNKPNDFTHALMGSPTEAAIREGKEVTRGMGLSFSKGVVQTGQGVKQFSLEALEGMGILDEGTAEAYTKKTDAERKLFEQEFQKEFGDKWQFTMAEVAGSTAPIIALTPILPTGAGMSKLLPKTGQFFNKVRGQTLLGGAVGAGFGATQYVPKDAEESRLYKTLEGAGYGAGFTALMNTFPALKNKFRDFLGKAISKGEAKRALALGDRTGHSLKLTQIKDDPMLKAAEDINMATISGERAAGELATKQINQNLKYWQRVMNKFSGRKEQFGTHVENTFKKVMGDSAKGTGLLGARKIQGDKDFAAVIKATGGKRMIKLDNFRDKATKLVNDWKHSADPDKRAAAKQIVRILRRRVSTRIGSGNREFKVDAKKLQDLLETYGGVARGSGNIFKDISPKVQQQAAKALFGKLQKDLNIAIKSGVKGARELKIARTNYEKNSRAIRDVEESALYRMFKKEGLKDSETLEKAFTKMTSGEMKGVMKILEGADPALRGRLQRFWLQNQLEKSYITSTYDHPIFEPHKMLELTSGAGRKTFKAIYDTAESRRMVMDGINATRRIIANNAKTSARAGSFLQKMAGVAASRDPTFVARLTSEILAPKTVSGYVTSPEGVRLLKTLAKTNDVNVGAGILIRLNNLRKEQEEDDGN